MLRRLTGAIDEYPNERRDPTFPLHLHAHTLAQTQPFPPREEVEDPRTECQHRSKVTQMFHDDHSALCRHHPPQLLEEAFPLLTVPDLMGRQRHYDQFRPAVLNGQ